MYRVFCEALATAFYDMYVLIVHIYSNSDFQVHLKTTGLNNLILIPSKMHYATVKT